MRSNVCESGRNERKTSPARGDTHSSVSFTFATKFACVSMTPLGRPVVPEV